MSIMDLAQQQLAEANYAVAVDGDNSEPFLMFESDSVLGFVLTFPDAASLIERWRPSSQRVLDRAQFALRRAETKSWNTYLVFLADTSPAYAESITLDAIEEDLVGTRKIARAGIKSLDDVRAALLPLLAMQHAPRLEAIDMSEEIRLRTSELPSDAVEAFLSRAPDATLIQLLEAAS